MHRTRRVPQKRAVLFAPAAFASPRVAPRRPIKVDEGEGSLSGVPKSQGLGSKPSLSIARSHVTSRILAKQGGFRDRRVGAFGVPDVDTKEPERTERLLASAFALSRPRVGDGLHELEGFLDEEAEGFVLKMWRMLIFEVLRVQARA